MQLVSASIYKEAQLDMMTGTTDDVIIGGVVVVSMPVQEFLVIMSVLSESLPDEKCECVEHMMTNDIVQDMLAMVPASRMI